MRDSSDSILENFRLEEFLVIETMPLRATTQTYERKDIIFIFALHAFCIRCSSPNLALDLLRNDKRWPIRSGHQLRSFGVINNRLGLRVKVKGPPHTVRNIRQVYQGA